MTCFAGGSSESGRCELWAEQIRGQVSQFPVPLCPGVSAMRF